MKKDIPKRNRRVYTDEMAAEIITRYSNGEPSASIAKTFGFHQSSIIYFLKNRGERVRTNSETKRIYALNETFFNEIDNPNKSYFLGLLLTDGNVSKKSYVIKIALEGGDKEILEKLRVLIESEKPLKFISGKNNHTINRRDQYALEFQSVSIFKDLSRFGIFPAKTFKTKFPTFLEDYLIRDFIRGCWDGDGSVTHHELTFTGTVDLCNGIKSYLQDKLNIHIVDKIDKRCPDIISIRIWRISDKKKFLNWLYQDAELFMQRKYDMAQDIINKPSRLDKK